MLRPLVDATAKNFELVHHRLLEYQWIAGMRFPMNVLVLVIMAMACGYLLALVCKPIQRVLSEKPAAPPAR